MLAVVFPFDSFGSAGTGAGALLLGDALREMLADAKRESQPARCHAFRDHVRIKEVDFDSAAKLNDWRATGRKLVRSGKSAEPVLWLAGNHLSVLPVYEELGVDSLFVQFDAHLDVYNLADCTTELSHGNFLMHAQAALPSIINVGSRDLFLPAKHALKHFSQVFTSEEIACSGDRVVRRVGELARKAKSVWIDIDCDVFDPAYAPGVQHPQPMGLSPTVVLRLLSSIWSSNVVGVSISEFDPGRDRNDQTLQCLVWLIEWCLLKWFEH
jgi:arginase family enzyme